MSEQVPTFLYSLEGVFASILESNVGPGNKVGDHLGHQHLSRSGERRDPCGDVHGQAANIVTPKLHLAGVDAGTHPHSQSL